MDLLNTSITCFNSPYQPSAVSCTQEVNRANLDEAAVHRRSAGDDGAQCLQCAELRRPNLSSGMGSQAVVVLCRDNPKLAHPIPPALTALTTGQSWLHTALHRTPRQAVLHRTMV